MPQEKVATLWRGILRQDPNAIFGAEARKLLSRNWGDRVPQPGYVGPAYFQGGLAFVSMNPGGMRGDGLGSSDRTQLEALRRLRDCPEGDVVRTFEEVAAVLARVMRTWGIFQKFVQPVLECGRFDLSQVAYLNLLKWRTQKSTGLEALYQLSWQMHTCDQIDLRQPSVVIAVGADAGREFRRLYSGQAVVFAIPRVIGNNIGAPGRHEIERICTWLASHPVRAAQQPAAPDGGQRVWG